MDQRTIFEKGCSDKDPGYFFRPNKQYVLSSGAKQATQATQVRLFLACQEDR